MAHPRWPGFNTKTGNPIYDNQSRRMNQRLYRHMKKKFKIRGASRKRKKQLMRVEGAKYIQLWATMMNQIAAEKAARKVVLGVTEKEGQ